MRKALVGTVGLGVVVLGVVVLVLLALAIGRGEPADRTVLAPEPSLEPVASRSPAAATRGDAGFLSGRVTTMDGTVYQGRLRFGGREEAFWSHTFDGYRDENPWGVHLPLPFRLERRRIELFGSRLAEWKQRVDLGRPFMARFGDITRIARQGGDLQVKLKSGTVYRLDHYAADDFADGLRVWDAAAGIVDLEERRIRLIDLFPIDSPVAIPERLFGTVRAISIEAPARVFTGFIQWNLEQSVGTDSIKGETSEGALSLPFDTIVSIVKESRDSSRVILWDGRELVLSGTREVGRGNRGVFVEDPRFGRVLIPWDTFERVDFGSGGSVSGGSGRTYDDYPPGLPLTSTVTTRDGRRLTGRLVYDLDESETTETLDASLLGVNYSIPFGRILSIELPGDDDRKVWRARVTLESGEELFLEPNGDLGEGNAGLLIFGDDPEDPSYVPWADVERIELERSPAEVSPIG
ncbi:MAG: hypothetical protein AAF560_30180 [Acidobacteriota bacterium]